MTTQAETVAPAAAAAASLKSPEKWKVLQMLPEKHRRLFIAILGLVVLLIIFFTLKPNSDTVESFEQQMVMKYQFNSNHWINLNQLKLQY